MALQLSKTIKGFDCNYWTILERLGMNDSGKTRVILALYRDKDVRDEEKKNGATMQNYIHTQMIFLNGSRYDYADLYKKIKESNMIDGVEQNEFASAEDC